MDYNSNQNNQQQNGYYTGDNQNQFYTTGGSGAQSAPYGMGAFQYETLSGYTTKTFGWMFAGLSVTFFVALFCYASGLAYTLLSLPFAFIGLAILELVVVFSMSLKANRISAASARTRFFLYAGINGVVFSTYFYAFSMFDLVLSFGATALYFGIMAGYGYLTKSDLSGWQKPLFFGLIAMLIVSVVGMFVGGVNILLCCAGIVLFACYTAYDTHKIKAAYFATAGNEELAKKASIFAALEVYLDFINLFLYVLRIFARNSDN